MLKYSVQCVSKMVREKDIYVVYRMKSLSGYFSFLLANEKITYYILQKGYLFVFS